MTMIAPPLPVVREPVTLDNLLKLGQQGLFELADGELVEKPTGSVAGRTVFVISNQLYPFIHAHGLGEL